MYTSQNPFLCKDISPCTLGSRIKLLGIQADFNQVITAELIEKINEQIVSVSSNACTLFELELLEASEILRAYCDFYTATEVEG